MNKILEALERLAMPDDLHKKECERLGIPTTQDYETLKAFILQNQNTKTIKADSWSLSICRDEIHLTIPEDENEPCYIKFRGDSKLCMKSASEPTWVFGIIDRHLAIALKTVLDGEQNKV